MFDIPLPCEMSHYFDICLASYNYTFGKFKVQIRDQWEMVSYERLCHAPSLDNLFVLSDPVVEGEEMFEFNR